MAETTNRISKNARIFGSDFDRLQREWKNPGNSSGSAKKSYLQKLRLKFDELASGPQGKRWYLPHSILVSLIDGSPDAVASAKQEFLKEWSHGDTLDRKIHYWNSLQFKTGDRWICAAMLSQLLILWDWLAVAGAWSEAEIDAAATEALDVVEAYLEPHLKGRGHMPFLPDPINQTAACVTGLLYAGHMFGKKWRTEPRGERMYALARNLVADCIGQFPANGYDDDGFTYLRHIHLQVHTMSVALLEEVEGGDWYHRKFAPHNLSLADLNAMQLEFVSPAGFAWPLGRYGYIRSWNLFNQSFASRRSGAPRYLQQAVRDNDAYTYESPWLGMDLPLGLLWYPTELDAAISVDVPPAKQRRRIVEDSWAVFTSDADQMLAVATWLKGKGPHFFLEAHGSPLILGGSESWSTSNGVQCDPEKWGLQSWLNPAGKLLHYCDIPGLQAVYFDSAPTYPPALGVSRAARFFVNCSAGLIVSDRFASKSTANTVWQAAVWVDPKLAGNVATVTGPNDVTLRAVSSQEDWRFQPTPERKPRYEGKGLIDIGLLKLDGPAGNGNFDVLLDWTKKSSADLRRVRDDLLAIDAANEKPLLQILLPGSEDWRELGAFHTDAQFALLHNDGKLCVAGTRNVFEDTVERIWASLPVDVTLQSGAYWVSGLKYGEFVTLRGKDHFVCVRVGNGIEVWGRSPEPLQIHIRHEAVAVELNGIALEAQIQDGWTVIDIPDTASSAPAAGAALRAAVAGGETSKILHALHDVQQAMAWECAADVRALFKWDASREPTLPNLELRTEATYVRLEAAATAMAFGDKLAIPGLIELLLSEARRNYSPPSVGPGGAKWWGFPTRNVTLEAIMVLNGVDVLKVLDEVLSLEVWAHGIDAAARARVVFANSASPRK